MQPYRDYSRDVLFGCGYIGGRGGGACFVRWPRVRWPHYGITFSSFYHLFLMNLALAAIAREP